LRGRVALHLPELALRAVALAVPKHRGPPGRVIAAARLDFSPRVHCGASGLRSLSLAGAGVVLPGAGLRRACRGRSRVRPGVTLTGTLGADSFQFAAAEHSRPRRSRVDPTLSELPVELGGARPTRCPWPGSARSSPAPSFRSG
jgi:hypothetical protein